MRIRLRPQYSLSELNTIYSVPHIHSGWPDHRARVYATLGVAQMFGPVDSAADLSCGDGWILSRIEAKTKFFGDYAPGYEITGPIEETINRIPYVDLFICSETVEHLEEPDKVLRQIRDKTKYLVLSTPSNETDPTLNPQHYWGWDQEEIKYMMIDAGFTPWIFNHLTFDRNLQPQYVYDFQVWGAE